MILPVLERMFARIIHRPTDKKPPIRGSTAWRTRYRPIRRTGMFGAWPERMRSCAH